MLTAWATRTSSIVFHFDLLWPASSKAVLSRGRIMPS